MLKPKITIKNGNNGVSHISREIFDKNKGWVVTHKDSVPSQWANAVKNIFEVFGDKIIRT